MAQKQADRRAERLLTGVIRAFLLVILAVLSWMSMSGTCLVYGGKEITQYQRDIPVIHLALLAAAVMFCAQKFPEENEGLRPANAGRRPLLVLCAVCAAFGILWMAIVPDYAGSDSALSMKIAGQFLEGNYQAWDKALFRYSDDTSGYVWAYPNQNGLILYMALLIRIFGSAAAPAVFRALNLGYLLLGTWCLSRFIGSCWKMQAVLLLFLPFAFYYLFVYGTLPGFGLSMLALYAARRFLDHGFRAGWLLLSGAAIALAVLLKSNYLIVLVALVLYLLGEAIIRRDFRPAAAAILIAAMALGVSLLVRLATEAITGCPVGGIPQTAWVEMGLQTGSRANGWYNGYNVRIFRESGADPAKASGLIRTDLRETFRAFASDPAYTLEFFAQKTRSQWTDPTFQSLWIQQIIGHSRIPAVTDSLWNQDGVLHTLYVGITNMVLSLIYEGAFLNALLVSQSKTSAAGNAGAVNAVYGGTARKAAANATAEIDGSVHAKAKNQPGESFARLIPAVIFIGGFLFHLFWEAKSQYTAFYVLLLIPDAVRGIKKAGKQSKALFQHRSSQPHGGHRN